MSKINILTPNIYNRIAAGEVVDRPYSVVKELVENAIDAGATEIEIRIRAGGKSYISVLDNGSGIEYSDLKSVFLPHATSKIEKAEDLNDIRTLGFRGEAVASISAVSHMKYTSKCKDAPCYKIVCNGGEIGDAENVSGIDGTFVEVEDLFYNTPVRLKFLKSDRAEEGDITSFVHRFILSHPEISFRYYADDRLVIQSLGEGEEETLVSIYGANILSDTYHIDTVKHGVKIRGFISNQNFFKPNKNYQSVFLNGRYIVNTTISAALTNAYKEYAMKRQYPFYVLHIDIPTEIVDVNVHPNKADVRFADNQIVYGCIYSVISAVLDGNSKALEYIVQRNDPHGEATKKSEKQVAPPVFSYEQAKAEILAAKPEIRNDRRAVMNFDGDLPFGEVEQAKADIKEKNKQENKDFTVPPAGVGASKAYRERYNDLYFPNVVLELGTDKNADDAYEANKAFLLAQDEKKKQQKINVDQCIFKGNLFNTFLIYEYGDSAFLIDQHAAHERLIFDRLKEKIVNRKVVQQPMLVPYSIHVSPYEDCFLHDYLPFLVEMGFDIKEVGCDDYTVSAIPVDLQDIALDDFFDMILSDTTGLKEIKLEDILKDKLAMCACKAAIKGGMSLTEEEVKALLKEMDGDTGLKCPHGRPVVVKLTKAEIEKMFKRIV